MDVQWYRAVLRWPQLFPRPEGTPLVQVQRASGVTELAFPPFSLSMPYAESFLSLISDSVLEQCVINAMLDLCQ